MRAHLLSKQRWIALFDWKILLATVPLLQHAFDSGSLLGEERVSDERSLFADAAHDYWRASKSTRSTVLRRWWTRCWRAGTMSSCSKTRFTTSLSGAGKALLSILPLVVRQRQCADNAFRHHLPGYNYRAAAQEDAFEALDEQADNLFEIANRSC